MKIFNFKNRNLFSGPHLLGTLLILAGLFALASPLFFQSGSSAERVFAVGIGAIVLGLLIISSYGGTMIDFSGKRFREYSSIGGYRFGQWLVLPEASIVKVISSTYLSSNTPNGISPTHSGKITDFKILVYSGSDKVVFSFEYSNRDKAVIHAGRLAEDFNVDLDINIPESD